MRTQTYVFRVLFSSLLFFSACSAGKIQGKVQNSAGDGVEGVVVRLVSIRDDGTEQSEITHTISQSNGSFALPLEGVKSASLVAEAQLPTGSLRAFAVGDGHQVTIDSVSNAVVQAVILVTAPSGNATLTDFSADELAQITATVDQNLSRSSQLLSDASALLTSVIGAAGRSIPDAVGASPSAQPLSDVVGPDLQTAAPTFTASAFCSPQVTTTGKYFQFDVNEGGALCNVNAVVGPGGDAFDGAFQLTISNGETFDTDEGFPGDPDYNSHSVAPPVVIEDGREFAFGPVTTDSGNLRVTRKVKIFENQDVVRYVETFENLTSNDFHLYFRVNGDLGLDVPRRILFSQNSPIDFSESSDYGAVITLVPNTAKPLVGWVIAGTQGLKHPDTLHFSLDADTPFYADWSDVVIPATSQATFLHYVYVSASLSEDASRLSLESIHSSPDMTGLSAKELMSLKNFLPSIGNVSGTSGTVVSNEQLDITSSSGGSGSVQAAQDGSFKAAISAISGDTITISGSNGTETIVVIP